MLEGQSFAPADRRERMERLFAAFERDDIEIAVDLLIDQLDARDGDLDIEPNGDELDGSDAEDEEGNQTLGSGWMFGPGCPYAECGSSQYQAGDPSWTEWQTRGRRKVDRFGAEVVGRDVHGNMIDEEAEDDDPAEDDGEDCCPAADDNMRDITIARMGGHLDTMLGDEDAEYAGDEKDGDCSEDDFMVHATDGGAGCPVSDPGGTEIDPHA